LEAISELKFQTILIYPNADAGGRKMIDVIKEYEGFSFITTFKSIPRIEYLSIMKIANVIIGNSSSGIIESPSFDLPAINIGCRQQGRERAKNVIDIQYNREQIISAIQVEIRAEKLQIS
jgi:UDP-N-acetylglucosamine 2-epimerase